MITDVKQQDIDLWEVWVEYDQFNRQHFGTLYVLGEILLDHKESSPLLQKRNPNRNSGTLVLQVPARGTGRKRSREVFYSEPITDLSQYTSVVIYSGKECIANFEEIEILI
jgi:hypothetical protein